MSSNTQSMNALLQEYMELVCNDGNMRLTGNTGNTQRIKELHDLLEKKRKQMRKEMIDQIPNENAKHTTEKIYEVSYSNDIQWRFGALKPYDVDVKDYEEYTVSGDGSSCWARCICIALGIYPTDRAVEVCRNITANTLEECYQSTNSCFKASIIDEAKSFAKRLVRVPSNLVSNKEIDDYKNDKIGFKTNDDMIKEYSKSIRGGGFGGDLEFQIMATKYGFHFDIYQRLNPNGSTTDEVHGFNKYGVYITFLHTGGNHWNIIKPKK